MDADDVPPPLPQPEDARTAPPRRTPFPGNATKPRNQRMGIALPKRTVEQLFGAALAGNYPNPGRDKKEKPILVTKPGTRIRDQLLLVLSYEFALRASEPGRIILGDLTLDPENPSFLVPRVKGGKVVRHMIPDHVLPLLRLYLDHYRHAFLPHGPTPPPEQDFLFPSREWRQVDGQRAVQGIGRHLTMKITKRFLRAIGTPESKAYTHHAIRHALGSAMTDEGFSPYEGADALGHKNGSSTQPYAQMSPEGTRRTRERMAKAKSFARLDQGYIRSLEAVGGPGSNDHHGDSS